MSSKVTIWAWKQVDLLPGPTVLLTFLALADMARDHGKVWASHRYIAGKSKQGERTVRASITALEEMGLLRTEPTPGRPDVIWLNLTAVLLFDEGSGTDEPGALEKGPRKPRQEMPTPTPAGEAGASAPQAATPAGGAYKPRIEPKKETSTEVSRRASRIPPDWLPDMDVCNTLGLTEPEALEQADRFRDYWLGAPGQKGLKADWPATWRNWCRRVAEEKPRGRGITPTSPDRGADQHQARVASMVAGARQTLDRWKF